MKLKLKGRRFDTITEIQAETQKVLNTLTEKDLRKRSKNGGDGGTGVYIREGTTSKVTAADRPYGKFCDFYSVSLETFGSTHVQFSREICEYVCVCVCVCVCMYVCTCVCVYIYIYTHTHLKNLWARQIR